MGHQFDPGLPLMCARGSWPSAEHRAVLFLLGDYELGMESSVTDTRQPGSGREKPKHRVQPSCGYNPVQGGFGGRVRAGNGQLWGGAEALAHRVFADAVGTVEFQGQQAGDGPCLRTLRRLAQLCAADAGHPARGTTSLIKAEVGGSRARAQRPVPAAR